MDYLMYIEDIGLDECRIPHLKVVNLGSPNEIKLNTTVEIA
jgi:hypothetical protein